MDSSTGELLDPEEQNDSDIGEGGESECASDDPCEDTFFVCLFLFSIKDIQNKRLNTILWDPKKRRSLVILFWTLLPIVRAMRRRIIYYSKLQGLPKKTLKHEHANN